MKGHYHSYVKNRTGLLLYWVSQENGDKKITVIQHQGAVLETALTTKGTICIGGVHLWHLLFTKNDKSSLNVDFLLLKSCPESVKLNYVLIVERIT